MCDVKEAYVNNDYSDLFGKPHNPDSYAYGCRRCNGTSIAITNDGAKTKFCGECRLLFK